MLGHGASILTLSREGRLWTLGGSHQFYSLFSANISEALFYQLSIFLAWEALKV